MTTWKKNIWNDEIGYKRGKRGLGQHNIIDM